MNKILALLILPLPSVIKVFILRMLGHSVHQSAYIGFSFLNISKIVMGENSYIGIGNIFTGLNLLEMHSGSRINRWNRITSDPSFCGILRLKRHSSISLRHYLDVCHTIEFGANTIVAGHRSTFFTHSKGVEVIDYVSPIIIGEWCYLGSDLAVAPGAVVGDHCFVGMGSVVVGNMSRYSYKLLVGNPAHPKKDLREDAPYFSQGDILHPHLKLLLDDS